MDNNYKRTREKKHIIDEFNVLKCIDSCVCFITPRAVVYHLSRPSIHNLNFMNSIDTVEKYVL